MFTFRQVDESETKLNEDNAFGSYSPMGLCISSFVFLKDPNVSFGNRFLNGRTKIPCSRWIRKAVDDWLQGFVSPQIILSLVIEYIF